MNLPSFKPPPAIRVPQIKIPSFKAPTVAHSGGRAPSAIHESHLLVSQGHVHTLPVPSGGNFFQHAERISGATPPHTPRQERIQNLDFGKSH